jgi:hypothetical protein
VIRLPYSGHRWIETRRQNGLSYLTREDGQTTVIVPVDHLGPAARASDPVSSHEAAARQTPAKVRSEHRLVLQLLAKGPMTDFDLASLASIELKRTVKSVSLGVRRGELVRMGLVRNSGTFGVSDTGSRAIRWAITDAGRKELAA